MFYCGYHLILTKTTNIAGSHLRIDVILNTTLKLNFISKCLQCIHRKQDEMLGWLRNKFCMLPWYLCWMQLATCAKYLSIFVVWSGLWLYFNWEIAPILILLHEISLCKKKSKAIPVTGHGGPWGCETSRLPRFLDARLTDDGKVVSLTRRSPFTPRKIPGTHFC
jgi:hypothetical protein